MQPQPLPIPFAVGGPEFRLRHFRRWIAAGWALDLNDAVRVNAQLLRNARHLELDRAHYEWGHWTAMKQRRRWEHHKRLVLMRAKSCTFCPRPASEITYAHPLSEGGTDRLRNKLPVCSGHADVWPQVRRDLPHRVREKLAEYLIALWGRDVHRA
ncbi:hypothetical protein OOK29_05770 [Streptomyces phaeochromogenes]|uniref:HNH endonuclease n=1 Tax=Streptomyces phaeochromogenes TaxID=1923 RepID=A0ABZ1HK51_STRPH|nr:hypothetical protein [Streptomyces phaeochromogenes]MCX5597644.1 hypothetical protein [Streptomyces phaeochromogenes]WSD18590.1 hypothetical protein OHB35_38140 [Streptomyces phaeochromogenes]